LCAAIAAATVPGAQSWTRPLLLEALSLQRNPRLERLRELHFVLRLQLLLKLRNMRVLPLNCDVRPGALTKRRLHPWGLRLPQL
jgi:hypothetical protein